MNKYILICKCSNMKQTAEMAYDIAFPNTERPKIYRDSAISTLIEQKPNTNFASYVSAIMKKNGRFAYYIEEENGDIMQVYDLLKGKRVA